MHTQARYCIVDWARVHRLNETREAVCHAAIDKDIEAQTGMAHSCARTETVHELILDTDAYFLWIIYAIGAQFSTGSEQLSLVGHARAGTKCDD